jgi:hypothetical protein
VHTAGISVRGKIGARERTLPKAEYQNHIVDWPLREPKAKKPRRKIQKTARAG